MHFLQLFWVFLSFSLEETKTIDTPGIHKIILPPGSILNINIPKNYQAFIFSNIDMGMQNSFFLNGKYLSVGYRNLFAIAFNESNLVSIRYDRDQTNIENIEIFIIEKDKCQYHSFYAMGGNTYDIQFITYKYDHPLKICGFSPSLINDSRSVTFGFYKSGLTTAVLNYHSETLTENSRNSFPSQNFQNNKDDFQNKIDNFQNKIDNFPNEMDSFQLQKIKKFHEKKNIKLIQNNSRPFVIKTETSEKSILRRNKSGKSQKENVTFSIISSDFNEKVEAADSYITAHEIKSSFYVEFFIHQPKSNAHILFQRNFDNENIKDNSLRNKHSDFLLYFRGNSASTSEPQFFYDKHWADDRLANFDNSGWENLRFIWLILLVIAVVLGILGFGCFCGCIRSDRICCFKRTTTNASLINFSSNNRNPNRISINQNNQNVNRNQTNHDPTFEEYYYMPGVLEDLDEQSESTKKDRKKDKTNESEKSTQNSSATTGVEEVEDVSPYAIHSRVLGLTGSAEDFNRDDGDQQLPNPYGLPNDEENPPYPPII
ncbi:hypothetical protein TRFO_14507 [Tritrichomonas foetus]|uniref:Uncharacterized protein n=1 Tax=Tritrichomonas foetus TaxID=1144522 RepID=A0A1J4KUR1_9EUKA|nr:hypothetical protein TRFO_14507 [Tritrichomonas foetus]|eukprot:OHT15017.1 hypothetical protein TRFO_14507 [Tritrichomonas foetus]